MSLIPLPEVVYDVRARDGTYCAKKPRCMNYPKCPEAHRDFQSYQGYSWFGVVEEFDLAKWEADQREKPWRKGETRKQLRNPRHWQKGVMKRLLEKTESLSNRLMGDVILEVPEACGVHVILTMAKVGVRFEWGDNAKTIRKVMLVGKKV